jgi:hypothetical protein
LCSETPGCRAWTFVAPGGSSCYLYDNFTLSFSTEAGYTTGVVRAVGIVETLRVDDNLTRHGDARARGDVASRSEPNASAVAADIASHAESSVRPVTEDVGRCLTSHQCDPHRSCTQVMFSNRTCLASFVRWRTPYATVSCCFKCCLAYWEEALGLNAVASAWRGKNGGARTAEVLMFHSTPGGWAHILGTCGPGCRRDELLVHSGTRMVGGFADFNRDVHNGLPVKQGCKGPSCDMWDAAHEWPGSVIVHSDKWLGPGGAFTTGNRARPSPKVTALRRARRACYEVAFSRQPSSLLCAVVDHQPKKRRRRRLCLPTSHPGLPPRLGGDLGRP